MPTNALQRKWDVGGTDEQNHRVQCLEPAVLNCCKVVYSGELGVCAMVEDLPRGLFPIILNEQSVSQTRNMSRVVEKNTG